jgi:hypothetical protein
MAARLARARLEGCWRVWRGEWQAAMESSDVAEAAAESALARRRQRQVLAATVAVRRQLMGARECLAGWVRATISARSEAAAAAAEAARAAGDEAVANLQAELRAVRAEVAAGVAAAERESAERAAREVAAEVVLEERAELKGEVGLLRRENARLGEALCAAPRAHTHARRPDSLAQRPPCTGGAAVCRARQRKVSRPTQLALWLGG